MNASQIRFALGALKDTNDAVAAILNLGGEEIDLTAERVETWELHDDVELLEIDNGYFQEQYIGEDGENLWQNVHRRGCRYIPYSRIVSVSIEHEPLKICGPYEK